MHVERRQLRIRFWRALGDVRHVRQQAIQGIACAQHDACAVRGQHRDVTGELNHVAKTFVLEDEDGLASDVAVAAPHRLGELRIVARTRLAAPARFAPRPTRREIAGQ